MTGFNVEALGRFVVRLEDRVATLEEKMEELIDYVSISEELEKVVDYVLE